MRRRRGARNAEHRAWSAARRARFLKAESSVPKVPRVADLGTWNAWADTSAPGRFSFPSRFAMHHHVAGLRYPHARVLLPRTRLAYIHLRNLLTDAKRDRAARISGYVAISLPDELVILYLLRGEVANATVCDARGSHAVAIANAIDKVPHEPEYGEISFHEADVEQLACMFAAEAMPPEPWPEGMNPQD